MTRCSARLAFALAALGLLGSALLGGTPARADWLQPDPSLRQAQADLRQAQRDTVGHVGDPQRLDSLAVALIRVGRLNDAEPLLRRVLDAAPADPAARAALGKVALFRGRPEEAESLLAGASSDDDMARADLFALRLRRGEYGPAGEIAESAGQAGRAPLLEELAQGGAYIVSNSRDEVRVPFTRMWPAPLVRVKLNGQSVIMAIDTGVADLLLNAEMVHRCGVQLLPSEALVPWSGSRVAARNALVQRLEIGGIRIERVPAGVFQLHRYSLDINPQSEPVAGIIGINLLRRFTTTLDFDAGRLVLRPSGAAVAPPGASVRVPFEIWGESEITVYGSLGGGRKAAMLLATGLPGCGVAAPQEVFDEFGIKPGLSASLAKGGAWLRGGNWMPVTVPSVSVGQLVRDRVSGWSGGMESAEMWRCGVRRDAVLAGDFFRGKRLTIDWRARVLVIEQ